MRGVSGWAERHAHALTSSAGHLVRHWLATLLTVTVMALALALPLGLAVAVQNALAASGGLSDTLGLSVFLKPQVSLQRAQQLAGSAAALSSVARVRLISATEALQTLRRESGFKAALAALPGNPLPNVLVIRPRGAATSPAQLDALRRRLAAWPEVDAVQLDRDWVVRFDAIVALLRRAVLVAGMLLAAGVLAVVGNTIRLEILNRRPEIEIMKLVGATNSFVRRPFLYTGSLYGVLAGVLAWGIVRGVCLALEPEVLRLGSAYGAHLSLRGPDLVQLGQLAAAGTVLGWLGAIFATARHLLELEPESG